MILDSGLLFLATLYSY